MTQPLAAENTSRQGVPHLTNAAAQQSRSAHQGGTNSLDLTPTDSELWDVFSLKHGDPGTFGKGLRAQLRFNYFTPDEHYESLVVKLVTKDCVWLDVGCGHNIFPNNRPLAEMLAQR